MNQISFYPRDSLTFAEPTAVITTPVKSWSKRLDFEVIEASSDEAWEAFDDAVFDADLRTEEGRRELTELQQLNRQRGRA